MANEEPNRSLLWPAVLVGIGVAGSLDEIVLHQLLRWHHFYDRGSRAAGLIADGIFHLGSTAALVVGLVLLVQRWRAGRGPLRQSVAGILLGAGGFNLYDGIVQHKLLGLHQVRAGAPTDVTGQSAVTSDAGLVHVRSASPAVDGADACAHGGCARDRATRVLTRPMTQPSVAPLTSAIVLGREGLRCVVNDPEHRW